MATVISKVKVGGGTLTRASHASACTQGTMTFAVFVPDSVCGPPAGGWPVLYWLSGLTCTDENFSTKGGAFGFAAKEGVALGDADTFLTGDVDQLMPTKFKEVCKAKNQKLRLRTREGYDHSYYFISSFVGEHVAFHAAALRARALAAVVDLPPPVPTTATSVLSQLHSAVVGCP
ncbi:S-formylglutathione hydrolase [Aureococcus anophagefferens]|nr:S-formylglutathione hydrolase [Aureococcus anophagefferens]